ncbi:unnamed protein product [Kluyveromyces dobzhanskii CBS 2104]|uniref:Protein STU1 n=1 Tax=Kluyveromyces dobzhanskii CBS 2104 TaxID=1427455 RepID=A0A0A8L0I9_9SACH|nr:unnamed protein product [Kluyveromyces dobzhanskii CBS 2104]
MGDEFDGLDGLFDAETSAGSKIELLGRFKAHVKKTLVNEQMCVAYFENLSRLLRENEPEQVFQLAHSAMCYLIKRVAMQAQYKFQHDLIELVVWTLLTVSSRDKKIWQSSVRALEAIYLAKPPEFCRVLNECMTEKESVRTNVLLLVDELARLETNEGRNASLFLQNFVPIWVQEMNTNESMSDADIELIYDIGASRCSESFMRSMVESVVNENASKLLRAKTMKLDHRTGSQVFDLQAELQTIMHQAPQFPTVSTPEPTSYNNVIYLVKDLEAMLPAFEGTRETERNWKIRQSNIIKLRSIVLGNISTTFPERFLELWKDLNLQDCVTKSTLSLRTSLCTHGCSLVKDLCSVFNSALDISIIENLWSCLAKLMANTKKIANQNAYICLITLLSTIPFLSRLFNNCFALIRDKNITSRLYSATFLRIFLIRFHKRLISHHHVYVEEWLQKGLTDAHTTIRESMRITFWYWYKVSPMSGKKMLSLFQPQIKRALESSIPTHLNIEYEAVNQPCSKETSRRSTLLPKRFPSYAAPTQSSHLPRSSIKRSLTDLTQGAQGTHGSQESQAFSKRSLRTPPDYDIHIDLTSELTDSQTNPLLNRYMKKNAVNSEPLYSVLSKDPKHGLDLLQKYLLSDAKIEEEGKVQFSITSLIRTNPKSFKPLLHLPKFYQLVPLNYSMILLSLNDFDISMIETQFRNEDIIDSVISILKSLEDRNSDWSIFYVRFKYQIYSFCFNTVERLLGKVTLSDLLINELMNACGRDLDAERYYELLLHIYLSDKLRFTGLLKSTSTASTKLKIANVIQKNDAEFKISSILNYSPMVEPELPPEEKHLLDMTMVNPLGKRTISSSTVLHNPLDREEEETNFANENVPTSKEYSAGPADISAKSVSVVSFAPDEPFRHSNSDGKVSRSESIETEEPLTHEEQDGFTKFGGYSKLTEMTKVHSVFQPESGNENIDRMDVDSPSESNSDQKSLLTDIFSKNHHPDEPPSTQLKELDQNNGKKHEYDSKMLSDAINGIDIETVDGSVRNISEDDIGTHDHSISTTTNLKSYKPITLNDFEKDSLLLFEMQFVDLSIDAVNLNRLKFIVHSIKNNGTFKMNELQYLLKCFLSHDQTILEWIHDLHELKKVCGITELLLSSSISQSQIPTNIAYKSIILTACLLKIGEHSETEVFNDSEKSTLFENMISLVAKLDTYENELYFACSELRHNLVSQDRQNLPLFLENCLEGLLNNKEQYIVKVTFLLETINCVIGAMGSLLSADSLKNLAKSVSRYTPSDVAEWRYASCTTLASIYKELISRSTPVGYIRSLMPLLGPSDFEVVRSLSTMKDATRQFE